MGPSSNRLHVTKQFDTPGICFAVVRRPTGTLFSIHGHPTDKRTVVAFHKKTCANRFVSLLKQDIIMGKSPRVNDHVPKGPSDQGNNYMQRIVTNVLGSEHKIGVRSDLIVEAFKVSHLTRRCSLNGLQLSIYHEQLRDFELQHHIMHTDEYCFHLENCLKYY